MEAIETICKFLATLTAIPVGVLAGIPYCYGIPATYTQYLEWTTPTGDCNIQALRRDPMEMCRFVQSPLGFTKMITELTKENANIDFVVNSLKNLPKFRVGECYICAPTDPRLAGDQTKCNPLNIIEPMADVFRRYMLHVIIDSQNYGVHVPTFEANLVKVSQSI